jgi:hypothetical protein
MSRKESNPPRSAIWLLRHAYPGSDNQPLTGDLVEKFREGRSHGWFWKQVLIAIIVGVLGEMRGYWPQFCYAIAGTAMPWIVGRAVEGVPTVLRWWVLPWPWSQLVLEVSPAALLDLAALSALAVPLVINGAFRWVSLLRTGLISLALMTLGHFLPDVFPWLLHPVPGNPYAKTLIIPSVLQILLWFSTLLVSAVLGCRSPRPAKIQTR